jgi:hypothetical protein
MRADTPRCVAAAYLLAEEALLDELRRRLDPDNDMCPVRNLLGDWERFDLLNLWLVEMS